jgi:hypothetical protein
MNDKDSAELARLECEVRELERVLVQRIARIRKRIERIKSQRK